MLFFGLNHNRLPLVHIITNLLYIWPWKRSNGEIQALPVIILGNQESTGKFHQPAERFQIQNTHQSVIKVQLNNFTSVEKYFLLEHQVRV